MKRKTSVLVAVLCLAMAVPALAQQEKAKKPGAKPGQKNAQPQAIAQLMKSVAKATPTEEQSAKIKAIVAKHNDKFVELAKQRLELLGAETIKKMSEARKAATDEGKKGKALAEAVKQAAGLDEAKQKELDELTAKTQVATVALKKEVLAVLDEAQREKSGITLPKEKGQGKNKKNDADK